MKVTLTFDPPAKLEENGKIDYSFEDLPNLPRGYLSITGTITRDTYDTRGIMVRLISEITFELPSEGAKTD